MAFGVSRARLGEVWRYLQAGVLNSAFGYAGFAGLVWLGLNRYEAQLLAHIAGSIFNYFTYSTHVFVGARAAKFRFILSYAGNYLLGLGVLAAISRVVPNPYQAGFAALVIVAAINYFVLKHLVFHSRSV